MSSNQQLHRKAKSYVRKIHNLKEKAKRLSRRINSLERKLARKMCVAAKHYYNSGI